MKEGASKCVERHLNLNDSFYGHILKWGISVVFIANALRRTPRVCVIPRAVRKRTYVRTCISLGSRPPPFRARFNYAHA